MLFGPKFHPMLDKMSNWRQSLFALVLATRQYPNFQLWTQINEKLGANEFKQALFKCWEFHADKFNHIDLQEQFELFSPYIPSEEEENTNDGAKYAFEAAISLDACIDAICFSVNTAKNASNASLAGVIRLCEQKYSDEILNEESLLDKSEIEEEINFQVHLMEILNQPRSFDLVSSLLELALSNNTSNIGLEQELQLKDFNFVVKK